jgi:hypothetical protein
LGVSFTTLSGGGTTLCFFANGVSTSFVNGFFPFASLYQTNGVSTSFVNGFFPFASLYQILTHNHIKT